MKIKDLTREFNPEAEIFIETGNGGFTDIKDVEWVSTKTIKESFKSIEESKQTANNVTLITSAKLPRIINESSDIKIEYDGKVYVDDRNERKERITFITEGTMSPRVVIGNESPTTNIWENAFFLDCDKCILSCKFKVKKIKYKSKLVDDLKIKVGHLLIVDYSLTNTYRNGKNGAQYATVYNSFSGKSKQISLNKLAKMINDGMEIYRIV